jgi:serine protease AprX
MYSALRLCTMFVMLVTLLSGTAAPVVPAVNTAYVEPGLRTVGPASVSIIVAADSSRTAAQAVAQLGGQVTSDLWLIDSVAATLPARQVVALAALPGIQSIIANHSLKSSDTGAPDVWPTDNKKVWDIAYPVTIDIGADIVQKSKSAPGKRIDGDNVTVAVVDSGVFFDKDVRRELGSVVQRQFLGQADFVQSTCRTKPDTKKPKIIGAQFDGYCALTSQDSTDGFGHGTAVASVIWNNFTDATTSVKLGVAPGASIVSVRVLDNDGQGSYETVIKGIQYVVQNKAAYNIRVLNLSLSAHPSVPYFVDPLNRAVERAWASGIAVLAAAGNNGGAAETITVPGNDPYVITVGAINGNRTAGEWADDTLPPWTSTGPTSDGFAKPDVVAPGANVMTFMYNGGSSDPDTQQLVLTHPDFSETANLFRMSGTSISTAVASGVVALMLQTHPELTPDQVKFRLMYSARPALTSQGDMVYNVLQQGMGRIWAPDAVLGQFPADDRANRDMDIGADLAHGFQSDVDLAYHYQGPILRLLSDDGQTYLYCIQAQDGQVMALGATPAASMGWLKPEAIANARITWSNGKIAWGSRMIWSGGMIWSGRMIWSGGMIWSGRMIWSGGMIWSGTLGSSANASSATTSRIDTNAASVSATRWIAEP